MLFSFLGKKIIKNRINEWDQGGLAVPFLSGVLKEVQRKKKTLNFVAFGGEPTVEMWFSEERGNPHHGFGDSLTRSFCLDNYVATQGLPHKEIGLYTYEVLNTDTDSQGTPQDPAKGRSKQIQGGRKDWSRIIMWWVNNHIAIVFRKLKSTIKQLQVTFSCLLPRAGQGLDVADNTVVLLARDFSRVLRWMPVWPYSHGLYLHYL